MRCVAVSKSTSVNMSFPKGDKVVVGNLVIICVGSLIKNVQNQVVMFVLFHDGNMAGY